jgi:hypothetical protein
MAGWTLLDDAVGVGDMERATLLGDRSRVCLIPDPPRPVGTNCCRRSPAGMAAAGGERVTNALGLFPGPSTRWLLSHIAVEGYIDFRKPRYE